MSSPDGNTLITHLEALRQALLRIVAATLILLPLAYWLSPYAIDWLTKWCFPEGGELYYFAPMEALALFFWMSAADSRLMPQTMTTAPMKTQALSVTPAGALNMR